MFNLVTYFLGVCIGEGVVEMDIWSRAFVAKFRITFKVCIRTGKGGGGQLNVDRCGQGCRRGGQKSLKMCGHPLWMAPIKLYS